MPECPVERSASLWERACSRKRYFIQHSCWLTHRFREQARSHIYGARQMLFRRDEALTLM